MEGLISLGVEVGGGGRGSLSPGACRRIYFL